jgi:hypothetical protein
LLPIKNREDPRARDKTLDSEFPEDVLALPSDEKRLSKGCTALIDPLNRTEELKSMERFDLWIQHQIGKRINSTKGDRMHGKRPDSLERSFALIC